MCHKFTRWAERVSNCGAGKLIATSTEERWALLDELDWRRNDRLRYLHDRDKTRCYSLVSGTNWEGPPDAVRTR
jgi:hypothetical protein